MQLQVLFANIPVSALAPSAEWYERFFGRPCDIEVNPIEVMWRIGDGAWLYLIEDKTRAGHGVVAMSVADLDATIQELSARGITAGTPEPQGDAGLKATVIDPDGNSVALIEVT